MLENVEWVEVVSVVPDGEEECVCIAVADESRLYATADGILTHNTTVDEGEGGRFDGRHGSRSSIVQPGGLPSSFTNELDRGELFERPLRLLFSEIQEGAEEISSTLPPSDGGAAQAQTSNRNASAPAAEYYPDGSIVVGGNVVEWGRALLHDNNGSVEKALEQAYAAAGEERWHVAQLVTMRNDWVAAGQPGSFTDWVARKSREVMQSIGSAVNAASPADAAKMKAALFATWELYFAPQGHAETADSVLADMASIFPPTLAARAGFLAEFTRQLQQAGMDQSTTETAGLMSKLKAWVQAALDALRTAYGLAKGGVMGAQMKALMDRTQAVLDGHEIATPVPGVTRQGLGGAFPTAAGRMGWAQRMDDAHLAPGSRGLERRYVAMRNAADALAEGMERAKSTRDERTIDGKPVDPTMYDVRGWEAMKPLAGAWLDAAAGLRGEAFAGYLRTGKHPDGEGFMDGDKRLMVVRELFESGRFYEFGLTRSELTNIGASVAGAAGHAMQTWGKVLDPVTRLKVSADDETKAEVQRVTGTDAESLERALKAEVALAQEQALGEALKGERDGLRDLLEQARKDLENQKKDTEFEKRTKEAERLRLEKEIARLEKLLADTEAKIEAATDDALADALRETRAKLRDALDKVHEEKARADQEREVGIAIGREEGAAEAEANQAVAEDELDAFEHWLMGEKYHPSLQGLESIETMARRYIEPSRWNREGFADMLRGLFPHLDENILSDAADRMNEAIENKLAATRRRAITAFMDKLAGKVKPKHGEHLGEFLNALKKASDFGVLDSDTFLQSFAFAFGLNGLTAARVTELQRLWGELQEGRDAEGGNFGMVRETLERQFKEAVNALAPAARWDNVLFNQFQGAVLSSASSILNQFSAMWRIMLPLDALRRGWKKGDVMGVLGDWASSNVELAKGLRFVLTGAKGESLGHLPGEVRGSFTPKEMNLAEVRPGAGMRVRGPFGGVRTLKPSTTMLLRLKELWAWRAIRGAEGMAGLVDARNNYADALTVWHKGQGLGAVAARAAADKDIASTPQNLAHAEAQARQEQATGLIGTSEHVLKRRIEEIIMRVIDAQRGAAMSEQAEQLTAYMNFKTDPLGAAGWMVAKMMGVMVKGKQGEVEGLRRVTRFFFLFGRFLGHTVDATMGYIPGLHVLNMAGGGVGTERRAAIEKVFGTYAAYQSEQHAKAGAGASMMLLTGALMALAQAMKDDEDDEPFLSVTGTLPGASREEKERLKAAGKWSESTFQLLGSRFNYSQWPELAPLLSVLGNVSDLALHGAGAGGDKGQEMTTSGAGFLFAQDVLASPIKRSTYKQWADLLGLVGGSGGYDPQAAAKSAEEKLANLLSSPVGGALRLPLVVDADRLKRSGAPGVLPVLGEVGGSYDAQGWTENLQRRVPFVVVGEKMINAYGEESPGMPFWNLGAEPMVKDKAVNAAARLNLDTGTMRGKPNAPGEAKTREAQVEYQLAAGREYVAGMVANEARVRELLASGHEGSAKAIVKKIGEAANDKVKAAMWPDVYAAEAKRAVAKAAREAAKAVKEERAMVTW